MHPQLQTLAATTLTPTAWGRAVILFSYNTTLSRGRKEGGRSLGADFNVRVEVFQDGWEMLIRARATERVVYYDAQDNPTGIAACEVGQTFLPADDEELDTLNRELGQQYAAWKKQLPEVIEFPTEPQSPVLPVRPALSVRHQMGTDRYGIEPAPDDDFDQRRPLGEAA